VSVLTRSMDPQSPPTAPLRGVVFIHSCPRALISHVEWALASSLGAASRLEWIAQPVLPGSLRAELGYKAPAGTAAKLASELRAFPGLRFEVTQEPGSHSEGERYACTPSLGIFRAAMGPHGDVLVNEERLRSALAQGASGADLAGLIHDLLGSAWDEELEAFRYAGEGASVRWMHEVG
jgi:hypothetical protein